ncbi:MAG: sulfite exporter TauE/SafE family protein [Ilumatobacter sp.]|uniref:sulfite exporter TauE/SafE family protein n=1 Tax=Ilumatobacter sp. TaxID=1967498 RepID=UPI003C72304B
MTGEIVAIALGLLVGLSLGALGGGGSTLAVPILVFVAGLQARDATTASLLVVGVASAFGVVSHLRNGNVRLGAGIAFGAAGIVGSRIGLLVNRALDENVLLIAFSVLIAFVAIRMYRSVDPSGAETDLRDDRDSPGRSAGVVTKQRAASKAGLDLSPSAIAKLAGAASIVGLLTGLFGVGGGFAVVPALTLLLKFPAREAIGTSLVVIVINAGIALAMRAGDIGFDWGVVAPFLGTVTIGVIVGTRAADNIEADRLTRAFALMLGAVAASTAVSALLTA